MSRKIFRELLSLEEAKKQIYNHFTPKPTGVESVPLLEASGRILAEDEKSPVNAPPFDRAVMDGYAVKAEDTFQASETRPVKLRVVGQLGAGEKPAVTVSSGEVVEIGTGAVIPPGANAVVMVEHTTSEGSFVNIYKPVSLYENIQAAGSDVKKSVALLRKGVSLSPREIGILASAGLAEILCFKKPTVAVASTGDELTIPGESLAYGKIYDVNGYAVCCSVGECGCISVFIGIIKDETQALQRKLKEGIEKYDALIVSGGTSAGTGDLLYRVIDQLGKPGIIVHGISVKPGKPMVVAVINGKPIFGLPGNPTSALTIFNVVVKPVLLGMAGINPNLERKILKTESGEKIFSSEGRREFLSVNIVKTNGLYKAFPIHKGAGAITALAESDGFIEIPEGRVIIEKGEKFDVELYSSKIKLSDLVVAGESCLALYLILDLLQAAHPEYAVKILDRNSAGSLASLRNGEVNIAVAHMSDDHIKVLRKFGLEGAVVIRGYMRKYGFIVCKGNPKGIGDLSDLLREDVVLVNLKHGSDARLIFDICLSRFGEKSGLGFDQLTSKIKGYDLEASSHPTVEAILTEGKADVGFGMQNHFNLETFDFIPITEELYDYVTRAELAFKPEVKAFLDILKSAEFRKAAEGLSGVRILPETGTVGILTTN